MSRGWDAISLECYWRHRKEGPEQLAQRLKALLRELETLHPVFSQFQLYSPQTDEWEIPLGDSRTNTSLLAQKFEKWVTGNKDREGTAEQGYRLQASARSEDPPLIALNVVGGIRPKHRRFPNQAALSMGLPATYRGEAVDRLVKPTLLTMVRVWQPDWASAHSTVFAQRSRGTGDPFPFYCGTWMIFLAERYLKSAMPPSDVAVENIGDGGRLFIAVSDAFDRDSPAHVEAAKRLHVALAPLDGVLSRWA